MKKLFVVTAFAAFAFAAHSAAACDWNREASAKDQVVATTDQRSDGRSFANMQWTKLPCASADKRRFRRDS